MAAPFAKGVKHSRRASWHSCGLVFLGGGGAQSAALTGQLQIWEPLGHREQGVCCWCRQKHSRRRGSACGANRGIPHRGARLRAIGRAAVYRTHL